MGSGSHRPWREGELLVRPARQEHTRNLADRLSEDDAAELYAAFGLGPRDGLDMCHAMSDEVWTAVKDDGMVGALWGLRCYPTTAGANVWLACDPSEITRAPISFTHIVKEQLRLFSEKNGILYGYADERNQDHLRWLRRLGFEMTRLIPEYGHEKRPFYEFSGEFTEE